MELGVQCKTTSVQVFWSFSFLFTIKPLQPLRCKNAGNSQANGNFPLKKICEKMLKKIPGFHRCRCDKLYDRKQRTESARAFYAALRDYRRVSREFQVLPMQKKEPSENAAFQEIRQRTRARENGCPAEKAAATVRDFFSRWQFTGVVVETCLQIVV